ncbi:hypothetical protein SLS60_004387 [Paraconiothyrium brasiliense]|uniref:DUF7025 domain-containing protein n=1 Tax=Paraconiothyrium brasiliense TaxID=300254 RepID=A0ABR3RKC6_9PLEO
MAAPSNQDGISIKNEEHALDSKDRSTLLNIAEVEAEPSSRVHQESGVDQRIADVTEDLPLKSFESIRILGDLDKTAESEESLGEICELHVYETRFNSKGEEVVLQVGVIEGLDIEEIRSPDAALVLMRYYDDTKALAGTALEIRSPYMRKAMAETIKDYPGVDTQTAGILKISGKSHCIFHYRKELYAYAQASDDEDVKEHVTYLIRYMEQALRKEIASYETHMVANTESPGLDFDSLWMTFRPGDLLYHNRNGEGQICRLKYMRMQTDARKPLRYAKYWYLSCEIINCDGEDFIYSWDHTRIFAYDGYRPVSDLNILPLRFHKDQMSIRESLLVRGKTFLSFVGVHHRNYHGAARFIKDDEDDSIEDDEYDSYKAKKNYETIQADGRVIVDCEEYTSNIDGSIGEHLPGSKLISGKEKGYEKLCDDDILICSPEVAGFSLQHRRWGLFKVSGLGIISFNQTAFDALVLPQQYKKLLKSLVKAHQK